MPVDDGDPPVVIASVPGKESEGREEVVFVYWVPRATRAASAEPEWPATYRSRSSWWKPSMLNRRTCSALPWSGAFVACAVMVPGRVAKSKNDTASTNALVIVMFGSYR